MEAKNLLIIDDEELLLKNMKLLLKKHANHIFTANNAKEGHRILQSEIVHCVICDISMPEMTGMELIKIIREEGNEVPFIFYSAFKTPELMKEAAKYRAFDFLTKPIFEDLDSVVARGFAEGFTRAESSEYQTILNTFFPKI